MKKVMNYILSVVTRRWGFVVAIAMLATFATALYLGRGQDVWFDESYSILLAKQPVPELLRLTAVDAHPPLFYLLLKAWGSVFGWSELALRTLSALLTAASVGVIAVLLRRLFTPRVALVALPFLTFAPFGLRYGYEIRMYALAALIGALGSLALVKAIEAKTDRRWWALYALSVVAGMYTLYMTAVIWLAHFVWLMIYHRRNFWRQPWVWAYVSAVVVFILYLPTVIFQMTHSALPGIGELLNLTHIGELATMLLIYTPEWSVGALTTVGVLIVVGLTGYLIDRARHRMSAVSRRRLAFILCLALVPISFFIIVSLPLPQPFFVPRYLAHVVLFIYALIGVAAALGWRYGYRKAAGTLFLVCLALIGWGQGQLANAGNFNFERMDRPQTSKVRQLVDCDKSVVVADDAYTYINAQYYFEGCNMLFYSPTPLLYQGGYAPLAGSSKRLASSTDLTTQRLVHLYWKNSPQTFFPDARYKLVSSVTYDQQITDTYELSAE
jgi:uncharacterized membrane protein